MARITVEDCIDKFESRFELVLVASNRARKIHSGESPTVEKDNDKPTVIALREIADESVSVDSLKEKLIEEYQTVSIIDEEGLSLDYSDSDNELNDEIANDKLKESDLNDETNILNEDDNLKSNEDKTLVDSTLAPENDVYTNISDDKNPEN